MWSPPGHDRTSKISQRPKSHPSARTRGSFCTGTAELRRNKAINVDRYTVSSLGAFDWRGALGAVKMPVLVVHGDAEVISAGSASE